MIEIASYLEIDAISRSAREDGCKIKLNSVAIFHEYYIVCNMHMDQPNFIKDSKRNSEHTNSRKAEK